MAKPKPDKKRSASQEQPKQNKQQMRVDPAHVIGDGRITAEEAGVPARQLVGAAGVAAHQPTLRDDALPAVDSSFDSNTEVAESIDPAALVQQVRTHATQLAAHLRRQQSELDHRESELNARAAEMESQVRSARLWLQQRQDEIAEQNKALHDREQLLNEKFSPEAEIDAETRDRVIQLRAAELAAAESNWQEVCKKADRELAERSKQLDGRARELDERQTELDVRIAGLDTRELDLTLRQTQLDASVQELQKRAAGLAEEIASGEQAKALQAEFEKIANRRQLLDDAEALVAQQHAAVVNERRELIEKREQMDELARADRKKLADLERELRADLDKKRETLRRRSDDLDARRAALKQLRSEVARAQREVLEMRLATEELWAKLCGTMAPAALTQSLSQIRIKLADQNRLATVEITEQKAELQAVAARLQEQHEKAARQKQELQDWMSRRQQEIESQASHLVFREQQLDAQETEFARRELVWQDERFGYQQEIRKLLRQLRRTDAVAA